MGYFKAIRQSIGSYMILPSKTQQPPVEQPQTPLPPPTPLKPRLQLDPEPLSPTTRTTQWLDSSITQKGRKDFNIHGVKGGRIAKNSPKKPLKKPGRRSNLWGLQSLFAQNETEEAEVLTEEADELEGDTLIENPAIPQGSNFENDTTIIADIDDALEDAEVTAELGDEPHDYAGWTEDEIWLLERINLLGSEPLLHLSWALDFPTLVPELYTMDDSRVLIKAINGNTCHGVFAIPPHLSTASPLLIIYYHKIACRALEGLNLLAARVRDRVYHAKLPPEPIIYRQLKTYYDWSMKDASLDSTEHIPIVSIVAARPDEPVSEVVARLTKELQERGRQYRTKWLEDEQSTTQRRKVNNNNDDDDNYDDDDENNENPVFKRDLPTLYGIVIKYSVLAFVTYDVANPDRQVKSLALFDFQHHGQDVWHALSIAILMVRARDYLMRLRDEGEPGLGLVNVTAKIKQEQEADDDPDA